MKGVNTHFLLVVPIRSEKVPLRESGKWGSGEGCEFGIVWYLIFPYHRVISQNLTIKTANSMSG
jgi:hypothetical protein